jgi:hypothetical protein
MACALAGINSVTDCTPNQGGIIRSFGTELANITSVTIASGVITNFTMSGVGLWEEYVYDRDQTANMNQVGALNNNRFTVEQTAFLKFKGITQAYVDAANKASECCDVVFVHVLANGTRLVQGFEYLTATGAPEATIGRPTRIVPTVNTDTSANEARMEYTIAGNANTFTNTTSLSNSAILAL